MRSVIADTSCLIILERIDALDILESVYGSVLVTPTVASEYGSPLPEFIAIREVQNHRYEQLLASVIDPGEASAISLALETTDPLLILDDRKGRSVASDAGIKCTGTLGVLLRAKERGAITALRPLLDRLTESGFRVSGALLEEVLRLSGER